VLTEWDEFKDLNFQAIFDKMLKPAFVFDGRNILDLGALNEIGFVTHGVGRS
jgi:UDPglucose 6-dehydrogenase